MPRRVGITSAKPSGLVGHWRFDETGTGVAIDYSGAGNHGNIVGATRVAGQVGGGLDFNGSSEYVTIDDDASLDITGDMTIMMWINSPMDWEVPTVRVTLSKTDLATNVGGYGVGIQSNQTVRFYAATTSANDNASWSGVLTANTDTHLAVTYDESADTLELFLDGASQGTDTVANKITVNAYALLIAADDAGGTIDRFYDGEIDDVRIYTRILPQSEIQKIHDDTV